jgi:hypothetical protein
MAPLIWECGGLPPPWLGRGLPRLPSAHTSGLQQYSVGALPVNRATARFILRFHSAGSKGCAPACPDVNFSAALHRQGVSQTHRFNQKSPARKQPALVLASAARECFSAISSRICRPSSRICPPLHRTTLCMQTSQFFRRARLQSMIHISSLASSFWPCIIVSPNHKSFHRRAARLSIAPSHAKVSRKEKRP